MLGATAICIVLCALSLVASSALAATDFKLVPYPKEITRQSGTLSLGPAQYVIPYASETTGVASASLSSYLPKSGTAVTVRLGSVEEGYDSSWLTTDENSFLTNASTSSEASIVKIAANGITVVGKGKWGMLYGVQTINQLVRGTETQQGIWQTNTSLDYMVIKDWPDMRWRCLSPQMTWYSGWNRLEGYDTGNWTLDEWKWLVDWSLLHKCNGWAFVFCGYWPFTLPGYEESTLDVASFFYDPSTGLKTPYRFVHRNIRNEFLPELIRYAQARGIKMYAYMAINSFDGGYQLHHPEVDSGGAAEMLPFAPGVHDYCRAFLRRIVDMGFDGFVFENPEANHVPYQNEECYQTFWQPFGYTREQAQALTNNAPLDAHLNYNAWLVHEYDSIIQERWHELGHTGYMDFYVISHVMFARVMSESKTDAQRQQWLAKFDAVVGRPLPIITVEADEARYVALLGPNRCASLGGRGGSCTCAMRRIASINNNWVGGPMGADLAYERACQKHIYEAGGFGAMGYIFEWTNTEVFGYIACQYLWRNAGVPGIDNDDQTGFLYYAYARHYGEQVGALVARAMDEGPCVNDAMVMEGIYGSQWPSTGKVLHRDYQYLAALSDHGLELATQAYRLYTGQDPDLYHPVYAPESFAWNGFDQQANKTFNAERLRLLCVSNKRSQEMCETALAHRMAVRLIAEGAPKEQVLAQLDRAIAAAKRNQLLYQVNYDDDYDWTDGLCYKVTEKLESERAQYIANGSIGDAAPALHIPWEKQSDIVPSQQAASGPGRYLSVDLGLDNCPEFFCLGVVYTIQVQRDDGSWSTIFRRSIGRRATGWEHWDIPIDSILGSNRLLQVRFLTDSYSRAQERDQPTWRWAVWHAPRIVRVAENGQRTVLYDFAVKAGECHPFVRLDSTGRDRAFDDGMQDSTGATFMARADSSIAAYTPRVNGAFGLTGADYDVSIIEDLNGQACLLGRVTNGSSTPWPGEPVSGATVQVSGQAATATTNAAGRYSLVFSPGTCTISVSKPGYQTREIAVTVGADEIAARNVELSLEGGAIAGVVKADAYSPQPGKAIAGATVEVVGGTATATTDWDGSYALLVPPGTFQIRASSAGYLSRRLTASATAGATTKQDIRLSPDPLQWDVVRDFSGSINPNGAWSYGCLQGGSFTPFTSQVTLNWGVLSGVPAGIFEGWDRGGNTLAVGEGYPCWIRNKTGGTVSYFGCTFPADRLFCYPWFGIPGIVKWVAPAAGNYAIDASFLQCEYRAANGTVSVRSGSGAVNWSATLAGLGALVVMPTASASLSAGEAVLFQIAEGPDANPTGDAAALAAGIRLEVAGGSVIAGTVRCAQSMPCAGQPISGATVSITGGASVNTGADGRYFFAVSPGSHHLTVSKTGYNTQQLDVDVAADERLGVDIDLAMPTGVLSGKVLAGAGTPAPGTPIAGARVELSGGGPFAITGSNGSFSVEVAAGTRTFTVSRAGFDPQSFQVQIPANGTVVRNVELSMPSADWDVLRDFSGTSNPNGLWSYGYMAGPAFTLLPSAVDWQTSNFAPPGSAEGWDRGGNNLLVIPGYPAIVRNKTGADIMLFGTALLFPGDRIFMTPMTGIPAAVKWTAPIDGRYKITASFRVLETAGAHGGVAVRSSSGSVNWSSPLLGQGTVRSFSVDSVWLASGEEVFFENNDAGDGSCAGDEAGLLATIELLPTPQPLSVLKGLADSTFVSVGTGKTVTTASGTFWDGSVYIEDPDRLSGIRMVPRYGLPALARAQNVTARGYMATTTAGERYIDVTSIDSIAASTDARPLGMGNLSILSDTDAGFRGLLVKVWGQVTYIGPGSIYIYIRDGSAILDPINQLGVRVILNATAVPITRIPRLGDCVAVTGVVSSAKVGSLAIPVIRPRGDADIQIW